MYSLTGGPTLLSAVQIYLPASDLVTRLNCNTGLRSLFSPLGNKPSYNKEITDNIHRPVVNKLGTQKYIYITFLSIKGVSKEGEVGSRPILDGQMASQKSHEPTPPPFFCRDNRYRVNTKLKIFSLSSTLT